LLWCALCGKALTTITPIAKRDAAYICAPMSTGGCGKIRIGMDRVESWVLAQVLAVVADLRVDRGAEDADDGGIGELRQVLVRDERALDEADHDHYAGILARPRWLKVRAGITARMESNQRALDDLIAQSTRTVIPTAQELERQWPTRDALWKQMMLSAVIERINVGPHPSGAPKTLPRRLTDTDASLAARREDHTIAMMTARVDIRWRA
jgi:hypothetical protein